MDDDILLVPEMIYRAVAIAQIAKPKRVFGGMMLASIRLIIPWKKAALSNGKIPLLSMDNGNFPIIYPYQQYFLYNPDGSIGYYCTYSGKKTRELLWQTWKTVRQVRAAYPQIAAYMQTQPFDEAYWQSIFQPQPRQNGENP